MIRSVCFAKVYPRVGGGTVDGSKPIGVVQGLSPRWRGNRLHKASESLRLRSIPALAGEPSPTLRACRKMTVYPRVGGGTQCGNGGWMMPAGLSPRWRGNRFHLPRAKVRHGSIPALAGEPSSSVSNTALPPVYPRVGGGTVADLSVSPRTWGLSPRWRGNLNNSGSFEYIMGSIPALAGEPVGASIQPASVSVYPRVGGGTLFPDK